MKKLALLVCVVALCSPAFAVQVSLPVVFPNIIDISMNDASSWYEDGQPLGQLGAMDWDAGTAGTQTIFQSSAAAIRSRLLGLELRSAFIVDDIQLENGTPILDPEDIGEITGVMHGLVVNEVTVNGAGTAYVSLNIEYAPASTQTVAVLGDDAVQDVVDGGGRVTLYVDETPEAAFAVGPTGWGAEQGGNRNRRDFGAFTDGDLVADGILPNLADMGVDNVEDETVMTAFLTFVEQGGDASVFGAIGYAFMNFIEDVPDAQVSTISGDGNIKDSWMSLISPATLGPGGDALIGSNLYGGVNQQHQLFQYGWQFTSFDPIKFTTVPEPTTCVLLGGALVALVRRRKRK